MKKIDIVKHFALEGFKRWTIYDIIKRYENGLPVEHSWGAGRPAYFDKKNLKRLRNAAAYRVGVTQKKLAKKFGVPKSSIHYNLKKLADVFVRKSHRLISILSKV